MTVKELMAELKKAKPNSRVVIEDHLHYVYRDVAEVLVMTTTKGGQQVIVREK